MRFKYSDAATVVSLLCKLPADNDAGRLVMGPHVNYNAATLFLPFSFSSCFPLFPFFSFFFFMTQDIEYTIYKIAES